MTDFHVMYILYGFFIVHCIVNSSRKVYTTHTFQFELLLFCGPFLFIAEGEGKLSSTVGADLAKVAECVLIDLICCTHTHTHGNFI